MARIRSHKPEIWSSEDTASVCRDARLLWIALWNFADDAGRGKASPRQVRVQVFPYDEDITDEIVRDLLLELHNAPLGFRLYEADGNPYFEIPPKSWGHQKISKPQPPKFPEPTDTFPGMFRECSGNVPGMAQPSKNKKENGDSGNVPGTVPERSARIGSDRIGSDRIGSEGAEPKEINQKAEKKKPEAPEWNEKELDGYAYIREWVEKDPIGCAAAVTHDLDERSRGGWGKLLKYGSKEKGGGTARTIFCQCLERLYGEMKQGEIKNPGAQLNNYLKEAYGYTQ